jgi:hypothetical protein
MVKILVKKHSDLEAVMEITENDQVLVSVILDQDWLSRLSTWMWMQQNRIQAYKNTRPTSRYVDPNPIIGP